MEVANTVPVINDLIEIPIQEMVIAANMAGGEDNTFIDLLNRSTIFTQVGLTPAFLYNMNNGTIELTSYEKLRKKYH